MDNYEGMKFIAEGSFSEVYKSYDKKNEKYVAIKKIKWEYETEFDEIMNEIFILKKVNSHPNIVSLECCIHTSKIINIIFPLYSGTLHDFFIKEELPSDLITDFVTQLLSGVSFLHSKEIIHRDLKPSNIMIDDRKNLKIGDFGSSFSHKNEYYDIFYLDEGETHQIQTLWYRAPEILLGVKKYSYSIDMWSLGCIFGGMVVGGYLFKGDSEICQLYKIFEILGTPTEEMWSGVEKLPFYKKFFPKWKRKFNEKFPEKTKKVELIEKLLEYDPEKRISVKDALSFFEE